MKLVQHIALQAFRYRIERGGRKAREWRKLRSLVTRALRQDIKRRKAA